MIKRVRQKVEDETLGVEAETKKPWWQRMPATLTISAATVLMAVITLVMGIFSS